MSLKHSEAVGKLFLSGEWKKPEDLVKMAEFLEWYSESKFLHFFP